MTFFTNPFQMIESGGKIIQTKSFINPKIPLFSKENLEKVLETITTNSNSEDFSNIRGLAGEILATTLFENTMDLIISNQPRINGKFIQENGKKGYVVNSSQNHIAKLISQNRIVILEKKETEISKKFGFKNIAEIDGLYIVKKENERKNLKLFYAIETKTGNAKMSAEHIAEDIVYPLSSMYNSQINYIMIGFKEQLYSNRKNNTLTRTMGNLYMELKEAGVSSSFIHFPFEKERFLQFTNELESQISGKIKGKAIYDINTQNIEFIGPDGNKIKGKFILD